ncbi:unnamed protein product [Urochloa humidicola]
MSSSGTSWSVGSWSDGGGGPWSDGGGVRRSPIPYRIGPLDYEPTIYCHCRKKAALWISWSDKNPGRRYLSCYNARNGGCNFGGWYEGPVDEFIRGLLVDLRDAVCALKKERVELKAAIADTVMKLELSKKETAEMLETKEAEIDGLKKRLLKEEKQRRWMLGLFVSVVVAVVLFKLV